MYFKCVSTVSVPKISGKVPMETPQAKRTANWSSDEIMELLRLIEDKKTIIKGKFSPTLTVKQKRDATPL